MNLISVRSGLSRKKDSEKDASIYIDRRHRRNRATCTYQMSAVGIGTRAQAYILSKIFNCTKPGNSGVSNKVREVRMHSLSKCYGCWYLKLYFPSRHADNDNGNQSTISAFHEQLTELIVSK